MVIRKSEDTNEQHRNEKLVKFLDFIQRWYDAGVIWKVMNGIAVYSVRIQLKEERFETSKIYRLKPGPVQKSRNSGDLRGFVAPKFIYLIRNLRKTDCLASPTDACTEICGEIGCRVDWEWGNEGWGKA
ncbi:hypothetical protein L2E82_29771 [Cichorium intybus]|uniref:Uncharacterized protein n=1 Tax=Cichorium intybus TaxID=13427 RepID=A0ACB9CYJ7_CICIN|nr:hypothetical protein L2E82_29771 [Cichorium intybus]